MVVLLNWRGNLEGGRLPFGDQAVQFSFSVDHHLYKKLIDCKISSDAFTAMVVVTTWLTS